MFLAISRVLFLSVATALINRCLVPTNSWLLALPKELFYPFARKLHSRGPWDLGPWDFERSILVKMRVFWEKTA